MLVPNKKGGFSTIITIILIAIIIPILLFCVFDIPYYLDADAKIKSIADNMAASAATVVIPEQLAKGILEIDEKKARDYILEDAAVWFNLEDKIYDTNVKDVKIIPKQSAKKSLFSTDPLFIQIKSDVPNTNNANVLKASRIEYFIHTTNGRATYTFLSGQKVTVNTPTVGVKISSKVRGPIFRVPVSFKKVGMTEAIFEPQEKH
ncbi:MAG: hypothetical protein RSC93_04305 [Erysipelotrichaceae bacterium]